MTSEIVAVEGDTGVSRVEVWYDGPPPRHYRDLWIVRLDEPGAARTSRNGRSGRSSERTPARRLNFFTQVARFSAGSIATLAPDRPDSSSAQVVQVGAVVCLQ